MSGLIDSLSHHPSAKDGVTCGMYQKTEPKAPGVTFDRKVKKCAILMTKRMEKTPLGSSAVLLLRTAALDSWIPQDSMNPICATEKPPRQQFFATLN